MRARLPRCVAAAFLLSCSVPCAAQEQTGAVQGVVRDSTGAVLPGAGVEARSQSAGGISTTVADRAGAYRFPALPPATYTVTASLQGFAPASSEAILALGQLLTIDLTLHVDTVRESVEVVSASPLIDVRQSASGANIRQLDRIPAGRDFTSVISQVPGAQFERFSSGLQWISIDGASTIENRYLIDGLDTTELRTGVSGKTMLLDFMEEVQVKSSGYNAEFGGATGGVINALTKSGSNALRGTAALYAQSTWGLGARRPQMRFAPYSVGGATATVTPETGLLFPDASWRLLNPVVGIGGPVVLDKVWFYAGYAYYRNDYDRDATFYTDPNQVKRHFSWYDWQNHLNYNITTSFSNNLRLRFAGSNQRTRVRGTAPALQPDNDPYGFPYNASSPWIAAGTPLKGYTTAAFDKNPDGSVNQAAYDSRWVKQGSDGRNDAYSGNLDWVVTPTIFARLTAGYFRTNTTTPEAWRGTRQQHVFAAANDDGIMTQRGFPLVPAQYQQPSGYVDNPVTTGTARDILSRVYVNGSTTFFGSLAGRHTVQAGARFERLGNDVLTGNTIPRVALSWGTPYTRPSTGQIERGTYGYMMVNRISTLGDVHSNNWALWLQDSWQIKTRLTINAGIRAENEHIPSYKNQAEFRDAVDIAFGFADKIAPRLGFAYDVTGNGKWKAYGSFGHFYDVTKLELARTSFGGDHQINYYWTLDTYDWAGISCTEGPAGCSTGRFIESFDLSRSANQTDPLLAAYFNRPGMTGIDPALEPTQSGEFTAGMDHELNAVTSVGVRYVHKWVVRTIEDVGIWMGNNAVYLIANPGEHYAYQMEPSYPSFVTPRPKRDYDSVEVRLAKRLADRWSATFAYTYSRLYGNYSGLASSDENGRISPNILRYYDNTIMSYDQNGHLVYGLLSTDRPHVFKASGSYDFPWGTSVGAFWLAQSGVPRTTIYRYRNYPVYPYGRGDLGRLPAYSNLDLVVSQTLRLGARRRLELRANISNLFDQQAVTDWYRAGTGYGDQPYRDTIDLPFSYYYNPPFEMEQLAAMYRATGSQLRSTPPEMYKQPSAYQPRREIRFEVKFLF